MLGNTGEECPNAPPLAEKQDCNCSSGHARLPSQEPLPPYELDPLFDNLVVHKRIGDVIAKAIKKRFSKR
jgi:hypothetical protein